MYLKQILINHNVVVKEKKHPKTPFLSQRKNIHRKLNQMELAALSKKAADNDFGKIQICGNMDILERCKLENGLAGLVINLLQYLVFGQKLFDLAAQISFLTFRI